MNLSSGSYTQVVPIEVPAFHGLEPKLALAYSSSGGNGFVGVGWSLSGFSTVEWVRTGEYQWGGPPDKYLLDGQELIACQGGSVSPSCTTGGTHSTKYESYLRIKFDSNANTWTVWGKDGTKTTFSPTLITGAFTVRWGQTSVVDTYGNTVNYSWACDAGDCYPSTVSYNGYTITLYRETRSDVLTFGEAYALGTTQYRLRSVIAQLGSSPIRGYKLTYATSPVTARSLLASVQQFGTDLTQTAGLINAGTSLPPQTFTYQNDTIGHTFQVPTPPAPTPPPTATLEPVTFRKLVNAVATGNTIIGVSTSGQWDAGGSSTRAIAAGDGYVEWTHHLESAHIVGLNDADNSTSYSEIEYALEATGTSAYVHCGRDLGLSSVSTSSRFRKDGDWARHQRPTRRTSDCHIYVRRRRNCSHQQRARLRRKRWRQSASPLSAD